MWPRFSEKLRERKRLDAGGELPGNGDEAGKGLLETGDGELGRGGGVGDGGDEGRQGDEEGGEEGADGGGLGGHGGGHGGVGVGGGGQGGADVHDQGHDLLDGRSQLVHLLLGQAGQQAGDAAGAAARGRGDGRSGVSEGLDNGRVVGIDDGGRRDDGRGAHVALGGSGGRAWRYWSDCLMTTFG